MLVCALVTERSRVGGIKCTRQLSERFRLLLKCFVNSSRRCCIYLVETDNTKLTIQKHGCRHTQKSRGNNKMLYFTSMYAVHEYQTSKAKAIIESNCTKQNYYAFLFSFILSNPFLFCPTFFKTRSLSRRAGVSRVL